MNKAPNNCHAFSAAAAATVATENESPDAKKREKKKKTSGNGFAIIGGKLRAEMWRGEMRELGKLADVCPFVD